MLLTFPLQLSFHSNSLFTSQGQSIKRQESKLVPIDMYVNVCYRQTDTRGSEGFQEKTLRLIYVFVTRYHIQASFLIHLRDPHLFFNRPVGSSLNNTTLRSMKEFRFSSALNMWVPMGSQSQPYQLNRRHDDVFVGLLDLCTWVVDGLFLLQNQVVLLWKKERGVKKKYLKGFLCCFVTPGYVVYIPDRVLKRVPNDSIYHLFRFNWHPDWCRCWLVIEIELCTVYGLDVSHGKPVVVCFQALPENQRSLKKERLHTMFIHFHWFFLGMFRGCQIGRRYAHL